MCGERLNSWLHVTNYKPSWLCSSGNIHGEKSMFWVTNDRLDVNTLQNHEPRVASSPSASQSGLCIIFHFWASNQCVHNQIPIDSTHILLPVAEKKILKWGRMNALTSFQSVQQRTKLPALVLTLQIRSSFYPSEFLSCKWRVLMWNKQHVKPSWKM